MKIRTTRERLLASSMICSMAAALVAAPAFAQDAAPTGETEVEELVITGSRIRLQDYVAQNPVTSVTSEAVELSGQTNVTQFLQDLPSLVDSIDTETGADVNTNFDGLSLLDLRNLGASRTLVLVDGRRHVASNPGTSSVDIAAIPVALIDRVEILTGGASAIYGADGVSGVVNFILKKDFEGADLRVQHGWSYKGGGDNNFISGLIGENFAGGRGNITVGFEYDKTEDVKFEQRSFTRTGSILTLIDNPDDVNTDGSLDNPDIPDLIPLAGLHYYDTSLLGSVYTNFNTTTTDGGASFLADGSPFINGSVYYGSAISLGGSGTPIDMFNDDLIPGQERYSLYTTGSFEVADDHEIFGELKYTSSIVDFEGQPSYDYGLFVSAENPFIPANILADAQTPGGFASTPAGGPYGPAFGLPGPGVLVARDNFYLGRSQQETQNETLRTVVGLRGEVLNGLDYEFSYVFGRANQTIDYSNVRLNDRYYAATDVILDPISGGPVCRTDVYPTEAAPGDLFGQFQYDAQYLGQGTFTPGANSGCIPLNLFGTPDPAAIDWVNGEGTFEAELTQHVVNGFITGDTGDWFSLPAGPLAFVLGGEYRKEKSTTNPDPLQRLAESIEYANLTQLGRVVPTDGEYDVSEAFTELSVPLLRDLPFAQELTVTGAYRFSDYSTIGTTDTWNVGGRWRPIEGLMFRGTLARAVRAPSVNDLFRGRQQTFQGFADPCDRNNINDGDNPTQRLATCTAALTALGVDPTDYEDTSSETTAGFITGNPDLDAEEAETKTYGVVFSPSFIPGLTVALDYYDIEITDAIASYTVQTIVNNCYDLPTGNPFCALITRTDSGVNPGRINSFNQVPGNLSSFSTAGYDLNVRYNLDPSDLGIQRDIGSFIFIVAANKLEKLDRLETDDAPLNDDLGEEGAPEWQANLDVTWQYKNVMVNYGYSWFDETSRFTNVTLATQPDITVPEFKYYEERSVHDIQVRVSADNGFEAYAGINNITDQEPTPSGYGDASYPVSGLGRFIYIGARMKIGSIRDLW